MNHRGYGAKQGLRCAGGDRDLGFRVAVQAVKIIDLGGDGWTQQRLSRHGRVLILAIAHMGIHPIKECFRPVKIREPLGQIERILLCCQRTHDGKNCRAYIRQLADWVRG